MNAAEAVAWVKPPEPIRGLDHLGMQAPCIALYGQLLPAYERNGPSPLLVQFTLKTKRMTRADMDEFVDCYQPANRSKRKGTWSGSSPQDRWRPFTLDEILARDKVSLDLFWLRDESLEDSANLPEPHVLAEEIADDLRSALEQIESVLVDLKPRASDLPS